MAGIFDFLAQLGQVAGPAARGYLGGQVQGIQYQNQLAQQQANQQIKQLGLALQQQALQHRIDSEAHKASQQDRSGALKYAQGLQKALSSPENYAEFDRNGVLGDMLQEIGDATSYATNPDASGPFVPKFPSLFKTQPGQEDRTTQQFVLPQSVESKINLQKAQTNQAQSNTDLNAIKGKRITTLTPLEAQLFGRRIDLTGQQGALLQAQKKRINEEAIAIPQKVAETGRHNKAEEDLAAQRVQISRDANSIRSRLADSQIGLNKARTDKLQEEIDVAKLADKLPPAIGIKLKALSQKMYTPDITGDLQANPDVIRQVNDIVSQYTKSPTQTTVKVKTQQSQNGPSILPSTKPLGTNTAVTKALSQYTAADVRTIESYLSQPDTLFKTFLGNLTNPQDRQKAVKIMGLLKKRNQKNAK